MTPWEAAAQYDGRVYPALSYIDEYRAAASHVTLDDFVDDDVINDLDIQPDAGDNFIVREPTADTFYQPADQQQAEPVSDESSGVTRNVNRRGARFLFLLFSFLPLFFLFLPLKSKTHKFQLGVRMSSPNGVCGGTPAEIEFVALGL